VRPSVGLGLNVSNRNANARNIAIVTQRQEMYLQVDITRLQLALHMDIILIHELRRQDIFCTALG